MEIPSATNEIIHRLPIFVKTILQNHAVFDVIRVSLLELFENSVLKPIADSARTGYRIKKRSPSALRHIRTGKNFSRPNSGFQDMAKILHDKEWS